MERVLFRGEIFQIGAFRCAPDHPSFRDSGPTQFHDFVFPRTSVWIQHEGARRFVADPNVVTFYNRGQAYVRARLSPDGDRSDWFSVVPDVLLEVLAAHDPGALSRPDRPFRLDHGPSDAQTYKTQRLLVDHVAHAPRPDPLDVEERALEVLVRVAANACGTPGDPKAIRATSARQRDLVEDAKAFVASRAGEALRLQQVARDVGSSVFHLCRVFRRGTGTSLHRYQTQIRLRLAIERLRDDDASLIDIALDLGFSSHSHFTSAFRRAYGVPPSWLRRPRRQGWRSASARS